MRLDISQLRQRETVIDRTIPPGECPASDDFRVAAPVALHLLVRKDDGRVRLEGRVSARLSVPCSRCLEPFDVPVDSPFDLRYVPQVTLAASGAKDHDDNEIGEDDLSTAPYDGESIDLGQVLEEQFYLALPMKPLCRDDCRGLCPACGTNLNLQSCSCDTTWVDPRMDALRTLFPDRTH